MKRKHLACREDFRLSYHRLLFPARAGGRPTVRNADAAALARPTPPDSSCEQLWFAGTHRDVGGDHAEVGLSYMAQQWMGDEAVAAGEGTSFDVSARQHGNRSGLYLEAGASHDFSASGE